MKIKELRRPDRQSDNRSDNKALQVKEVRGPEPFQTIRLGWDLLRHSCPPFAGDGVTTWGS